MPKSDTKTVILDTAERLFADRGFGETSLRTIITKAGVNLAAVHYHFGSKERLIEAVLLRRMEPLNAERLRMLGEFEREAGRKPVALERVLEALFAPALNLSQESKKGGDSFMRLLGRMFSEPSEWIQRIMMSRFREVFDRFMAAIQKTLPKLPPEDFFWRIHFLIGAMSQTMCDGNRARFLSGGKCDPSDVEAVIAQLVTFAAAGLRAPGVAKPKGGKR